MKASAECVPLLARGVRAASRARVVPGENAVLVGTGEFAEVARIAFAEAGAVVTMVPGIDGLPAPAEASLLIDATGDPEVILTLLERAAKTARIVLMETTRGRTVDVDFYRTVHLRGLEVIGVGEPEPTDVAAAEALLARIRA